MTHKLTEEQQRAAHKVIVANRGDCTKIDNYLNCHDCPKGDDESCDACDACVNFPRFPEFRAENLRTSQAWLDKHITDAEIMAETRREFCERMVRTEGYGRCFAMIKVNHSLCKNCVISINGNGCCPRDCLSRAKAYLSAHPATPQEPAKRRPTPEEMVVGATVRVRLWDELVKDGVTKYKPNSSAFTLSMKKFCGNTYKIIKRAGYPYLEGCADWTFTPEMLDYVDPEKVVKPKASEPVNFFDWLGKKVVFKDGRNRGINYMVCEVYNDLDFDGAIHFKSVFFFKLLELKGQSFPAHLFNLCETQDASEPEPLVKAPTEEKKSESVVKGKVDNLPSELRLFNFGNSVDGLRIADLESQVADLTKKLVASERKCDRLARRLRAKWEAARDGEMATREEIIDWYHAEKGSAHIRESGSTILPKGRTTWIPATRGNLKL